MAKDDTCVLMVNPSGRILPVPAENENRLLAEAPHITNSKGQSIAHGYRVATEAERKKYIADKKAAKAKRDSARAQARADANSDSMAIAAEMAKLAGGGNANAAALEKELQEGLADIQAMKEELAAELEKAKASNEEPAKPKGRGGK